MRAAWFDFRFIPLNFDLQGDRISVCLLGKLSMEGSLYGTRGFFSLAFYHWDCLDAKSWSDCKISEELYWTWLDIIWDGEWEKKVNFQLWGSCFGLTCSRTSWCQTLHCPTVDPGWLRQQTWPVLSEQLGETESRAILLDGWLPPADHGLHS